MISITIKAENLNGLAIPEVIIDDFVEIKNETIDISLLEAFEAGPILSYIPKFINAEKHFIGYDTSVNSIDELEVFHLVGNQVESLGLVLSEGEPIKEIPLDFGDVQNSPAMFTLIGNTVKLWQDSNEDGIPDTNIFEFLECYGANFGMFNYDQNTDFIAHQDYTYQTSSGLVTNRVMKCYYNFGTNWVLQHTLFNQSPSRGSNIFYPRSKSGDFDNDGNYDLLVSDQDGDVMMYEFFPDGTDSLSWQRQLPVESVNLFDVGDFDGDSIADFCAGGYVDNISNPEKTVMLVGSSKKKKQ